jgi:Tfp pilus assembly protein PilV
MLMKSPQPTLSTLARSQHGYSLIELLVAMLSATVVAGALFAVLSFSTRETTTLADKVQADQLGRGRVALLVPVPGIRADPEGKQRNRTALRHGIQRRSGDSRRRRTPHPLEQSD